MPEVKSNINRFRKNLKQFLDLKVSGKLNGKAAVVEEKLRSAAEVVDLDFDKELARIKQPRQSAVIGPEKKLSKEDMELLCHGLECIENDEDIRENKGVKPDEIYQMITDRLISTIKKSGGLPWHKPWSGSGIGNGITAMNFVSKKPYRGINWFMLNTEWKDGELVLREFENPYFLTFNQVNDKGGKIIKGSKGNEVVYFTQLFLYEQSDPKLEFGTYSFDKFKDWLQENSKDILGNKRTVWRGDLPIQRANPATLNALLTQAKNWYVPILKYYNVFHASDIEGIDWGELPKNENADRPEFQKIRVGEAIWENYPGRPKLKFKEPQAFYNPPLDYINMPIPESFDNEQYYYSTLFHEAIHSTGSSKRLARDMSGRFGSEKYAFEELIAELGATFLCSESGILFKTIDNSSAYLQGWNGRLIKKMEDDNKFFFRASSRAQEATDYILDRDDKGVPAYMKDLDLSGEGEEKKDENETETEPIGISGKSTTVDFKPDGSQSVEGRYQLIELANLTASHNKDCSVNSKHRISKGQPRDRSLDNLCAQPKFIAKNLNPSSITKGNLAFQGAPVVMADGMVIQGNGRSISLKIAYDEIQRNATKYKEYLEENASQYGFKKSDVTGMKQPVLVRMLDVDDKEAIRLGNIVDTSQAKMSRIDQAKAIIRNLTPSKLQAIGRIIASSSGETIGAIIDDIGIRIFDQVKDLDRTGLIEKGELTSDGKEFLRSVLTGIIFDSDKHKSALRDFLDNPHVIQAGLERSFGNIIPLIGQKGDIREQIQEAVQITAEVKRNSAFDSVEDVMSAQDMFSGAKNYSRQGQDLARFLLDVNTQKEIRDAFRSYTSHIEGKDDLFNPIKATTQPKAFDAAFVKRENPPEHIVKLLTPADFRKGDIIRDYYEDEKFWIEKVKGKKYHTKSLETGKKEVFHANEKRFIPNRPVTPTMDLFPRKNFTIRLEPKEETKATKRFEREGTDFEKAVVRAMVDDENYKAFTKDMSDEQRKGFYKNLSWRLSQFQGPKDEPLWFKYIKKPFPEFMEAIKREAKKMYKADSPRKNTGFGRSEKESKRNIRDGIWAIKTLIEQEAGEAPKAMMQPQLGWVSFVWGRPGKPANNFKGGYGISHIIAKRDHEAKKADALKGQKGLDVALRLPVVIEKGTVGDVYENGRKVDITYGGYQATLRLDKDGKDEKWLLTGYRISKRKNPDELGEVQQFIQTYAPEAYMSMRPQVGAGSKEKNKKNPGKMRQNGNRTDIRLVKPKYQFPSETEAWETVQLTTGLTRDQVKPAHTEKSWRWKKVKRQNADSRQLTAGSSQKNRTDIRLVKPKDQFDTVDEAWESVHKATGLFPVQVKPAHTKKAWVWKRIDEPRQNPKARFVMLGISKELVIDQGEHGMKKITLPMAMFTNKKADKLFLAPFSELKELDFDVKDKEAEEVFKMWHNYPADKKDFEVRWPAITAAPVGFAHSILYASDKKMKEWDAKGKLNLYEHDFDAGKRPAFRKGRILIIANLKINERGILN